MSKRLLRTILYALVGLSLVFLRDLIRLSSHSHLINNFRSHSLSASLPLNNAWGSIVHRFENHPTPSTRRIPFPWTDAGNSQDALRELKGTLRVWIVTAELDGLHNNGGIGTALRELAGSLSREREFDVSILVAHPESAFTVLQRTALEWT